MAHSPEKQDAQFSPISSSSSQNDVEKGDVSSIESLQQSAFSRYFKAEIDPKGIDIAIVLCWFTTGFLDSTIFNAYRTFVSMQTGNTIFIGLGASNSHTTTRPYGWLKSLVSLIAFLLGCLYFARLSRRFGPLRRRTFTLSFITQVCFLLLAGIIVQTNLVESRLERIGEDIDFHHLIPIILLSFQAPGQTCMGRQVDMPEVSMVVVTSMVYDFGSDDRLFKDGLMGNAKRNRRFAGFVAMLLGAIVGGFVTLQTKHIAASIWTALGIKTALLLAFFIWPRQKSTSET